MRRGVGDPAAVFDVAGKGEADAEQGHGAAEQRTDEGTSSGVFRSA